MASYTLRAQSRATASRAGELQAGGGVVLANSDYTPFPATTPPVRLRGFGVYATFDFRYHLGVEAAFHQASDANAAEGVYQRTYEIGPRYVLHYGRLAPYAKLMFGRGVFNFPPAPSAPTDGAAANLAYNLWAGGAGADLRVARSFQVRADYEFQQWMGFPPHGLDPRLLTLGVAYRFYGR